MSKYLTIMSSIIGFFLDSFSSYLKNLQYNAKDCKKSQQFIFSAKNCLLFFILTTFFLFSLVLVLPSFFFLYFLLFHSILVMLKPPFRIFFYPFFFRYNVHGCLSFLDKVFKPLRYHYNRILFLMRIEALLL